MILTVPQQADDMSMSIYYDEVQKPDYTIIL